MRRRAGAGGSWTARRSRRGCSAAAHWNRCSFRWGRGDGRTAAAWPLTVWGSQIYNSLLFGAEREGFEPSMGFHPYTLSRRAPSAARTPLRRLEATHQPHPGARVRCCRCSLPGLTGFTTCRREGTGGVTIVCLAAVASLPDRGRVAPSTGSIRGANAACPGAPDGSACVWSPMAQHGASSKPPRRQSGGAGQGTVSTCPGNPKSSTAPAPTTARPPVPWPWSVWTKAASAVCAARRRTRTPPASSAARSRATPSASTTPTG